MTASPEFTGVLVPEPDPTPRQLEPLAMLQALIDRGADPASLGGMYDLVKRWKDDKARAAYQTAMVACQSEMPVVVHDAENKFLKSTYVKLEQLQFQCKPVYTRHGFSLSWGEEPTEKPGTVRVIADVMHKDGHTQRYSGDYPMDGAGMKGGNNMNPLQGRVSSNTYAQRDMLRSIFNITVAGKDLDGNNPADLSDANRDKLAELWTAAEQACVDAGVPKSGWDKYATWFLKWMEAERLDDVHPAKFQSACLELVRKAREPK